jgi:iron(III) transport system permease protein
MVIPMHLVLQREQFLFLTFIENSLKLPQKILTSGILTLVIGLSIRFYSLALSSLSTSFLRISDSHFDIIALSNRSKSNSFLKAILPMIKPGIFTAALMIFVEVMKEMPMTLMTRPFGKETLSIRIFEMTSEGEWERAALPSLFLIIVSLIPTILLFIQSEKNHEK